MEYKRFTVREYNLAFEGEFMYKIRLQCKKNWSSVPENSGNTYARKEKGRWVIYVPSSEKSRSEEMMEKIGVLFLLFSIMSLLITVSKIIGSGYGV